MRITQPMVMSQVLNDIRRVFERIAKKHEELSSGLKVRYPSDDAIVATRASRIASQKREIEQYKRNIDTVSNMVQSYDVSVREISDIYKRIRELAVMAANDTMSEDDRDAVVLELRKLKDHLVSIANTRIGDTYIFGGSRGNKPPISVDEDGKVRIDLTPEEASRRWKFRVGGYSLDYNLTVYDLFVTKRGESVFDIIDRLIENVDNNESSKISETDLAGISDLEGTVGANVAFVGGIMRMVENLSSRLQDLDLYMDEYLSKETDADMVEVVTKLSMDQAILQAALNSGARIIMPTLLDFLR